MPVKAKSKPINPGFVAPISANLNSLFASSNAPRQMEIGGWPDGTDHEYPPTLP